MFHNISNYFFPVCNVPFLSNDFQFFLVTCGLILFNCELSRFFSFHTYLIGIRKLFSSVCLYLLSDLASCELLLLLIFSFSSLVCLLFPGTPMTHMLDCFKLFRRFLKVCLFFHFFLFLNCIVQVHWVFPFFSPSFCAAGSCFPCFSSAWITSVLSVQSVGCFNLALKNVDVLVIRQFT